MLDENYVEFNSSIGYVPLFFSVYINRKGETLVNTFNPLRKHPQSIYIYIYIYIDTYIYIYIYIYVYIGPNTLVSPNVMIIIWVPLGTLKPRKTA